MNIEKPFLYLKSEREERFINLMQIASVSEIGEDRLALHMSDGQNFTVTGGIVTNIITLLVESAVLPDGSDMLAHYRKPTKSESSSASPTEAPELER